jgi:hypothetical protein
MFKTKLSLPIIQRSLICLLGAYFLISFGFYIYRLAVITPYPYELAKGAEGILLNETIKIINGRPIYTNINERPYLIANYPPLYQIACASVMKLTGSRTLLTGRVISSLSSLCIGALIFLIVFNKTGLKLYALFAVAVFYSFWYVFDFAPYFRVDLLGILFGLTGLYWVEKYSGSNIVYLSVLLFVMAFFTKQSFVFAPASAAVYLFFKSKTKSAVFTSLLLLTTGLIFWTFDLSTKGEFHKHLYLTFTGAYRWDASLSWFKNFVISYPMFIFLALCGIFKLYQSENSFPNVIPAKAGIQFSSEMDSRLSHSGMTTGKEQKFTNALKIFFNKNLNVYAIYFFFAFIPVFGIAKTGAYANYYIELCLAMAILTGIGFKYVLDNFSAKASVITLFLLCFQMNNLTSVDFNGKDFSISRKPGWSYFPTKLDYDNGAKLVSAIKSLEGRGFSEGDNTSLALAGKEIEYHYFLPVYIPAWNPENFLNDVKSGRYSFFISRRHYDLNAPAVPGNDFESTKFNLFRQLFQFKEKIGDCYIYNLK